MKRRFPPVLGSSREQGTVLLVAGLSGAYAAALMMASSMLSTIEEIGTGAKAGMSLNVVSTVFILIALYVAAVVITGCVATVIAGRLRQVALLRILGADGRDLRRSIRLSTARTGAIGALLGVLVGTVLADAARLVLLARATVPEGRYSWATLSLVWPIIAITVASAVAGWIGSRRILEVTPAQALADVDLGEVSTRGTLRLRFAFSMVLIVLGAGGLLWAVQLGENPDTASGFIVAFFASAASATGVLLGARFIVPRVVAALSRLLGTDPSSVIARRNATADPLRTTRSTVGLIVGVTLITTFASGASALRTSINHSGGLTVDQRAQSEQWLSIMAAVMMCVVLISCIISCVGFVSTMSLTVIQRRREIGLLRALGFTAAQIRSMITRESVALSATAMLLGVFLGVIYGSVGAQALVGSFTPGFAWGLPWPVLAAIAVGGVILVFLASKPPARRAIAVSPVDALHAAG